MARNPNPPPSEVRTFLNPIAIRYDSPDGFTHHYYREWHGLELRIDQYRLSRILSCSDAEFGIGPQEGDEAILRAAYTDYPAMTADDKAKLRNIQTRERIAAKRPDVRRLQGWAEISNRRTIRVFEAGRDGKPQGDFDQKFRRLHVNIRSFGDEDPGGSLFFPSSGESYDTHPDGSDAHPMLDLVVRRQVLEALEQSMRDGRNTPLLTVHVDVLLYQSEVERALSEPHHPQELSTLKEVFTPAVLAHLVWDETPTPTYSQQSSQVFASSSSTDAPLPVLATNPPPSQVRGLTAAVWALVVVAVIGILLR